jgi:hypothetical protein
MEICRIAINATGEMLGLEARPPREELPVEAINVD